MRKELGRTPPGVRLISSLLIAIHLNECQYIGYLLGKNPTRTQSFPVAFGQIHVFYPVAEEDKCTVVLLLDIDPGYAKERLEYKAACSTLTAPSGAAASQSGREIRLRAGETTRSI